MSYKPGWKPGRWSAICDRCGFRFHSDAIKTEWTGLKVCSACWETRNPQDFLRLHPERIVPPWTRPEIGDGEDEPDIIIPGCTVFKQGGADYAEADCAQADAPCGFVYVCTIWAQGGADYAEADCAQADAPYRFEE